MKTLLIAGGSGGHLIPAMALAQRLRADGPCHILSTQRPVDRRLHAVSPDHWSTVELERLTPLWRWLTPRYTGGQFRAVRQVRSLVRKIQPDVVVGFGGYLSAVGVLAARLSGVPTMIHEQNLLPGRANRFCARFVECVAVSFPETRNYLPSRSVVEITGNPVRPSLTTVPAEEARARFGFDVKRPVLLVMGGSQGSKAINQLSIAMWEDRPRQERQRAQVLHLAGFDGAPQVEAAYDRLGLSARVFSFLHEMDMAYAAASLAISRAGATAIAEMVAFQVPALLIPYPHAGGHQRANAHWMESQGGALVLEQDRLTGRDLWERISAVLWAPDRLDGMRAALRGKAQGAAVERLGALVRRLA